MMRDYSLMLLSIFMVLQCSVRLHAGGGHFVTVICLDLRVFCIMCPCAAAQVVRGDALVPHGGYPTVVVALWPAGRCWGGGDDKGRLGACGAKQVAVGGGDESSATVAGW